MALRVRELTNEENEEIKRLAQSRTAPARRVERARMIWLASQGRRVAAIAADVHVHGETVRLWLKRFNAAGLEGLQDAPRSGRPATYTPEQVGEVIASALTNPQRLGLPFGCWTLDRLEAYLNEEKDIPIKRSRIDELLIAEGLRWRTEETWFGERATMEATSDQQPAPIPPAPLPIKKERAVDPDFAHKRGAITTLYTAPPPGSVTVCLDQMGPESAKSFPGQQVVRALPDPDDTRPAERARQEIDYGRRGSGYIFYIFGAFKPADGEALTAPYDGRTIANWVDFLEQVEDWIPAAVAHVYGIVDNLNVHRATDVLLFSLAHPRWEFVFQPKYAAYLNLIEPWWKILRSLALKGRRFETWEEVCQAVREATAYWNKHRHPFVWGRRRRHRARRKAGVARLPIAA